MMKNSNISIMVTLFFILLGGLLGCSSSKNDDEPMVYTNAVSSTYTNPVYNSNFSDPTVIRAQNGYFYSYCGPNIIESKDLVNWSSVGKAFAGVARPHFLMNGTDTIDIWAPDIQYINGEYVMYYALYVTGTNAGIGVATSVKPEGPFTDLGSIVTYNRYGGLWYDYIDPCYYEENGQKYIFYGSFGGIYCLQLDDTGLKVKDGSTPVKVGGNEFEGTMIYKHDGYYYLFASTGTCCDGFESTYTTVVARSTSLLGPYLDKDGNYLLNNAYVKVIEGNDAFIGTGHNSEIIADDNGDTWLLYHAWCKASGESVGRVLMLDKITWVDDWPVVNNGTPTTTEQAGPVFNN